MHENFVYSIDLKDAIPYADRLDDNAKVYIERCIVDVVYDSFVVPGDQDYVTSRLLAQKGLHRAFYWAASQTLEKYLKALIVLNGQSVKSFGGHSINNLLVEALKISPVLDKADLSPHKDINIDPSMKDSLEIFTLSKFIADIDNHGSPDNRYNSFGVAFNTGHLFALDSFCHLLRSELIVPNIYDSFKRADESLISAFNENNLWFCNDRSFNHSKIPCREFSIKISLSVTKLDFLVENINEQNHKFALTWLYEKMKLPKKIKGLLNV
jgi:hypothetical protein